MSCADAGRLLTVAGTRAGRVLPLIRVEITTCTESGLAMVRNRSVDGVTPGRVGAISCTMRIVDAFIPSIFGNSFGVPSYATNSLR